MPLTFAGSLDRRAVVNAVDQLAGLVGSTEVAEAWEQESTLPGMTIGGLTRHLVSQPQCAVEFLSTTRSTRRPGDDPGRALRTRRLAAGTGRGP